jgi:Tol biopolymer transport system component
MQPDGIGQKQLTSSTRLAAGPSGSAYGKYVVFSSSTRILRINIDGSNLTQLTDGSGENDVGIPQCSPDSKWVIYQNGEYIWKLSIDGGTPVRLAGTASGVAWAPAISPDGRLIAHYSKQGSIEVIEFEGGQPVMKFPLAGQRDRLGWIQWAPDGQAIEYVIDFGGASNIWMQPLGGSPPRKLTDFKAERINRFAWSQDGKQVALNRGGRTSDILMIETGK